MSTDATVSEPETPPPNFPGKPKYLYRYCSAERALQILRDNYAGSHHASADDSLGSMGQRDVEPPGFAGSCPLASNIFLHQWRSIAAKRGELSVVLTVKLPNIFENLSNCAELLNREKIEWE